MPHNDDKQKREEDRKAWDAALVAEAKRKAESAVAPELVKKHGKKDEKAVKFAPGPGKSKGWAAVVEAAKQEGIEIDAKTGALEFNSREDALTFFKAQAALGHEFFAREYTDGKAKDFYVLSCNKHLYSGSLSAIKKDLETAIKKHPEDAQKLEKALDMVNKASASHMREQLQGHRNDAEEKTQAVTPTRR